MAKRAEKPKKKKSLNMMIRVISFVLKKVSHKITCQYHGIEIYDNQYASELVILSFI